MNSQHLISVLISEMNINNHSVLKFSWPINMSITSICDNQKYAIPSIVPLNILNLKIHTLCLTRLKKYHNKRGKGKGIELKLSTLKKKNSLCAVNLVQIRFQKASYQSFFILLIILDVHDIQPKAN